MSSQDPESTFNPTPEDGQEKPSRFLQAIGLSKPEQVPSEKAPLSHEISDSLRDEDKGAPALGWLTLPVMGAALPLVAETAESDEPVSDLKEEALPEEESEVGPPPGCLTLPVMGAALPLITESAESDEPVSDLKEEALPEEESEVGPPPGCLTLPVMGAALPLITETAESDEPVSDLKEEALPEEESEEDPSESPFMESEELPESSTPEAPEHSDKEEASGTPDAFFSPSSFVLSEEPALIDSELLDEADDETDPEEPAQSLEATSESPSEAEIVSLEPSENEGADSSDAFLTPFSGFAEPDPTDFIPSGSPEDSQEEVEGVTQDAPSEKASDLEPVGEPSSETGETSAPVGFGVVDFANAEPVREEELPALDTSTPREDAITEEANQRMIGAVQFGATRSDESSEPEDAETTAEVPELEETPTAIVDEPEPAPVSEAEEEAPGEVAEPVAEELATPAPPPEPMPPSIALEAARRLNETVRSRQQNSDLPPRQLLSGGAAPGSPSDSLHDFNSSNAPPPFWLNDPKDKQTSRNSASPTRKRTYPLSKMLTVHCPSCRAPLHLSREHLGVEGECPHCSIPIVAFQGSDGQPKVIPLPGANPGIAGDGGASASIPAQNPGPAMPAAAGMPRSGPSPLMGASSAEKSSPAQAAGWASPAATSNPESPAAATVAAPPMQQPAANTQNSPSSPQIQGMSPPPAQASPSYPEPRKPSPVTGRQPIATDATPAARSPFSEPAIPVGTGPVALAAKTVTEPGPGPQISNGLSGYQTSAPALTPGGLPGSQPASSNPSRVMGQEPVVSPVATHPGPAAKPKRRKRKPTKGGSALASAFWVFLTLLIVAGGLGYAFREPILSWTRDSDHELVVKLRSYLPTSILYPAGTKEAANATSGEPTAGMVTPESVQATPAEVETMTGETEETPVPQAQSVVDGESTEAESPSAEARSERPRQSPIPMMPQLMIPEAAPVQEPAANPEPDISLPEPVELIPASGTSASLSSPPKQEFQPLMVAEADPVPRLGTSTPSLDLPENVAARQASEMEYRQLAEQVAENFLESSNVSEKARWVLNSGAYMDSIQTFSAREALDAARSSKVRFLKSVTEPISGYRVNIVVAADDEGTTPQRLYVVQFPDGLARIDWPLYEQLRLNSLYRYLAPPAREDRKIFRLMVKEISADEARGVDRSLYFREPRYFEVSLPWHDSQPSVITVPAGTHADQQLSKHDWSQPVPAIVELRWVRSETRPDDPQSYVPVISKLVKQGFWAAQPADGAGS